MKSCLLFLGVFFGYFSFGQKSQDTIPDLRKVITTQVVSYQVKPDVEGVFDINSGRVYETMVVTKNSISKKSLRKLTKVLFKPSTYTQTSSNSQAPLNVGKVLDDEQKETKNATHNTGTPTTSPSSGNGSGPPPNSGNSEGSGSVNVAVEVLQPVPFDLSALASGGISNRYTHILAFENGQYVNVALCLNLLENSIRVYSYMQPKNLKQAFDPTKPYIFSGKLSAKARFKLRKFIP